jgi:hypothetical protein
MLRESRQVIRWCEAKETLADEWRKARKKSEAYSLEYMENFSG